MFAWVDWSEAGLAANHQAQLRQPDLEIGGRPLGRLAGPELVLKHVCRHDPARVARALDVIAEEAGTVATRVAERGRLLLYRRIG